MTRPQHHVPVTQLSAPGFPPEEYEERLFATRAAMERQGLTALLVTAPEDIHYLCGLDHQGHFAVTGLLVPIDGAPVLVERAMEAPTAAAQTVGVGHHGYGDATDPADALLDVLTQLVPAVRTVGYQADSLSLPPVVWDRLRTAADVTWADCSALLGARRSVHTDREIARIRVAARLSDTAMAAGLAASTAGRVRTRSPPPCTRPCCATAETSPPSRLSYAPPIASTRNI